MWLKILLAVLIIAFCTCLGYFAAGKYRERRKFYAQLSAFNEQFLGELAYTRTPLNDFLQKREGTGEFQRAIGEYVRTREAKAELRFLEKGEREDFLRYLDTLGKGDARAQSGFFSAQKGILSEKKESAEREAKARGDLYLKLGLLAGLAFVILIV